MNKDDEFRDLVKRLRKKMKLSQTGLADLIGVDYVTVNRWENGHAKPSQLALRQVKRIARKAGVS